MTKRAKTWFIIVISLILICCMIFVGVLAAHDWDFVKLSAYETNHYQIKESFHNITIDTDTADIVFTPSEDFKTSVTCHEQKNMKHTVKVENGSLVIKVTDTRKWYEYIGIHFNSPKITISIPQGEYGAISVNSDTGEVEIPQNFAFEAVNISTDTGNVITCASTSKTMKIKTSTGNIRVENLSAGKLDLSVSTGNITVSDTTCLGDLRADVSTGKANITDTTCQNLISNGTTGDLTLKNVIAAGKFSIERDTGDVKFEKCDAGEIHIQTDTGDVKGSLLTAKVFLVETDTGRIDVPKTTTGGKCEIETDTGNIKITIN